MKKILAMTLLCSTLLMGCSNAAAPVGTQSSNQSTDSSQVSKSKDANFSEVKLSVTDVEKIFKDQYKEASITSIELEKSKGTFTYKVKGMDDTNEYKLKIDSQNGDIKSEKSEKLDKDDKNKEALDLKKVKSLDDIIKNAEKEFPDHKLEEAKLKIKNGVPTWKLEFKKGFKESKISYNAEDGKLIPNQK